LTTVLVAAGWPAVVAAECAAGDCVTVTGAVPQAASPASPTATAIVDSFITYPPSHLSLFLSLI
jgi:hypothetical protein